MDKLIEMALIDNRETIIKTEAKETGNNNLNSIRNDCPLIVDCQTQFEETT
jgi:hypothetical protein